MGKKKKELMEEFRQKFLDGATANKIDTKNSSHIFDLIEFFAGYGFNKSHSTAYALITYQTAYLKSNYPTEFMAAVMTCEMSNTDKIVEYLEEARKMEITINPPNLCKSERGFTVVEGEIWYGLEAIKGVGGKVVDSMVATRDELDAEGEKQSFGSIYELCERLEGNLVNKTLLESLISSGALDGFGQSRSVLHSVMETALSRGAQARKDRKAGQTSFFDLFGASGDGAADGEPAAVEESYPELPEWSEAERLSREKKTLGFYLSGHPLLRWESLMKQYAKHTLRDVSELPDGTPVRVGVQIAKLTKKVSKRTGQPFWIALVEDIRGTLELFINQDLYEKAQDVYQVDNLVFISGKVKYRDTTPSLRLEDAILMSEAPSRLTRDLSVVIPITQGSEAEDIVFRLKDLLRQHRGSCPVFLVFKNGTGERAILRVGEENFVSPDVGLLEGIEELCGRNRVYVNRMRNAASV